MACAFAATLAGIVAGWGIAAAVFWPARAYGILAGGIACTVLYNRWLHGLWRPGKTGTGS